MAAARRINLNRLFSSLAPSSSSNTISKTWVIDTTPVRSEYTDRIVKLATQQLPQENQDQETVKKQEQEEITHQGSQNEEDDEDGGEYVNKETGEIGGPKGPEPTRFGDWERNAHIILLMKSAAWLIYAVPVLLSSPTRAAGWWKLNVDGSSLGNRYGLVLVEKFQMSTLKGEVADFLSQASLLAEWNSPPPGLKLILQADAMEIGAPTSQAETGPSGS
ncbi:hypothetical protein H0E87_026246 [Populus deltoides]|uniref:Succinate dehydrogenase assembly factor 4, mitochondrial n=1 Tax=Populus deltoides TaxID=3696 RepID=A0A8T2X4L2_POPDE|nr:hypothetical protein H0E87_026246 [Populus deltoides]